MRRFQKENSLKIYDDQLKKIDETAKAEERLTKTKEYENKKRELEDKRALDRLNNQRNYNLAIYEGRIDDARTIALEGNKAELDAQKDMTDLETSRKKELADQRKEDLITSIKDARDIASKYYDDMIDSFTKAAKKITEFPPTTAEEFNTQLNSLADKAKEIAGNIGSKTSEGFTGALANLGVDSSGPLTSAMAAISKTLTDNNPFGENGVWQTTIDASINGLKNKYIGLTNTLNTAVGESSKQFKELFTIYKNYKELVAKNEAEIAGGTGGAGGAGGGAGGTTPQTGASKYIDWAPGYYYRSKEKGQKNWSPWVGPRKLNEIEAIKPILSKNGLFQSQFYNYNPGTANVGIGAGTVTGTSSLGLQIKAIGGEIHYGKGGPTNGPVQQGIPAILHGGEYVVRNSAVKKYGWGMMQQINQGTFNPKPFVNGGMIKEMSRQIGQKWASKDTRAQREWQSQMRSGYANEEYWNAVGRAETGVDSSGRTPRWRRRNKNGGGGLAISEPTWNDYGGQDFARRPELATAIQQMVIANRIGFAGYTKIWPVGSSVFPAGMVKNFPASLNGWGVISGGSIPRPENFQTSTYRSAFGHQYAKGGIVPGFDSMGVPALLHGGEYVINSKAVKNIGFAALEAMNNMRFQTPKAPSYSGPVSGQASSSSTVHIYVDNFIGEKAWFESMMKDYNINVSPQNQKAAGLQNRTISTYNGINRGL